MNRKEEYEHLLSELDNTPLALEYTVMRAKEKTKKRGHIIRLFMIPASSIAIFFITFIIMVNTSITFAMACGRIPLLRELAAAVAMSPSLSAAVTQEYVQPIQLEQSENEVTMRIEYVIVDRKQLNVFYSLRSDIYSNMGVNPSISNPDGTSIENYSMVEYEIGRAHV